MSAWDDFHSTSITSSAVAVFRTSVISRKMRKHATISTTSLGPISARVNAAVIKWADDAMPSTMFHGSEGARALTLSSLLKRKLMFGPKRASHSATSTLPRARSAKASARCSGALRSTVVTRTSSTVAASTQAGTKACSTFVALQKEE